MDIGEYEEHPKGVYARCDVCGDFAADRIGDKRLCAKHLAERKCAGGEQ